MGALLFFFGAMFALGMLGSVATDNQHLASQGEYIAGGILAGVLVIGGTFLAAFSVNRWNNARALRRTFEATRKTPR